MARVNCWAGALVLIYHDLAEPSDRRRLPRTRLREQLRALAMVGRQAVGLIDFWSAAPATAARQVVLTFDDGYDSAYQIAFPELQSAGVSADFFIPTALVGQSGYLSWAQMAEMSRAGMRFHSHGHEHIALSPLPWAPLRRELTESKARLEDRLGCAVHFLAAPYGFCSRRVLEAAAGAGYHAVCGSFPALARPGHRFIPRIVSPLNGRKAFGRLLAVRPGAYCARMARHAALALPKRLLLAWRPEIYRPPVEARSVEAHS